MDVIAQSYNHITNILALTNAISNLQNEPGVYEKANTEWGEYCSTSTDCEKPCYKNWRGSCLYYPSTPGELQEKYDLLYKLHRKPEYSKPSFESVRNYELQI